jgi:AbrB family looped-hinge helix DNA binding protein
MSLSTTKMSSRGQVVIPEEIRVLLKLKEGSRFVVFQHDDTVILKVIAEPSPEEFQSMLEKVRQQGKKAGIKKSDVAAAVKRARRAR